MQMENNCKRGEFGIEVRGILAFQPKFSTLARRLSSEQETSHLIIGVTFTIAIEDGARTRINMVLQGFENTEATVIEYTTVAFDHFPDEFLAELRKPGGVKVSNLALSIAVSADKRRRAVQISRVG